MLLVEDAGEAVHLGSELHAPHLRRGVEDLGPALRHQPQGGLGVSALPGPRHQDDAEGLLIEDEWGYEVGLRQPVEDLALSAAEYVVQERAVGRVTAATYLLPDTVSLSDSLTVT